MITGLTFSLVIAVAVVGSLPSPSARREQFDLEDLMNKFLTEYDTKTTEPQHQPVAHQENIDFNPEPESYFPDAIEEQSYYSEPQEYYQEPQEQSSFYPEPQHDMEHQHQHQQPHQQPHHHHPHHHQQQHPHQHPHQHKQQQHEMSGYKRYKDSASSEQSSSQQKQQQASPSESRPPQSSAGESQEQQESLDPKLRDFTLIISKLLFQLSQL